MQQPTVGWCDLCGLTSPTGRAEVVSISAFGKAVLIALTDTIARVSLSIKLKTGSDAEGEAIGAELEEMLENLAGSEAEGVARTKVVRELQDAPADPTLRLVLADIDARTGDLASGNGMLQALAEEHERAPTVASVAIRRLATYDPRLAFESFLKWEWMRADAQLARSLATGLEDNSDEARYAAAVAALLAAKSVPAMVGGAV